MVRGSTTPFQRFRSNRSAMSWLTSAAGASALGGDPNATPRERAPPAVISVKRECSFSSPIPVTFGKRAAGTSSVGWGLPIPNGRRDSSCSARSSPSTPPGTTASTRSTGIRSCGASAAPACAARAARNGSTAPAASSTPAAMRWPPKRVRWRSARGQAGVEVVGRDAATRAAARAVLLEGDHHAGTAPALDQARGHDADHARMPVLPGDDDRPLAGLRHAGGLGGEQDARLGLLAVAVEQVELTRHLGGATAVLGQQQLERGVGAAHAPGGVDARPEPEAERLLGELRRLDRRDGHQRP